MTKTVQPHWHLELYLSLLTLAFFSLSVVAQDKPPVAGPITPQQTAPQLGPSAFPPSKIHEEVLAEATAGSEISWARSYEDHVAWVEKLNGKKTLRLDGKQLGGVFDDVQAVRFSKDGQRVAAIAKRNSKWVLLIDGEERSQEYGKMTAPALSPNGKSFAVGACREKKCRLVVNNEETGPEYSDISAPGFSPVEDHSIYFGKRDKKWIMVLDGKEFGPQMNDYYDWWFSSDGKRTAVAALMKDGWAWIVDGQPGPAFDVISDIAFSPDSQHYAYGATDAKWGFSKHKTRGVMVVDGKVAATYEGSGFGGGWQGLFGSSAQIVTGVRSLFPDFHGVSDPQYASDGTLVYAARQAQADVAVLVNNVPGPIFEDIVSPIVITGDAKHIAYVGKRGDDFVEVRDQKAGPSFPAKRAVTFVQFIILSKDGSHLAYEIVRGGNMYKQGTTQRAQRNIVLDGQLGKVYDALGLGDFIFNSDGKYFAHVVQGAEGSRDRVVFNGLEGNLYDDVFYGTLKLADEQTIEFVARNGQRFVHVTETLE